MASLFGLILHLPHDLAAIAERAGSCLPRIGGSGEAGLPVPAVFVIDRTGLVTYALVDPDHSCRTAARDIVAAATTAHDRSAIGALVDGVR